MKTAQDPRHKRRRRAVCSLYTAGFGQAKPLRGLAGETEKSQTKIDKLIQKAAPQWPLARINRIDLAILRLAVYELTVAKKEPPKVIIDEAVELAKEFGSESSPGFVNGALGNILKKFQFPNPKS
jgi:N utilization substance protein B